MSLTIDYIELFKQLLEFNINEKYIDLHNDFVLNKSEIKNSIFELIFINEKTRDCVKIKFVDVIIDKSNLIEVNNITLDNFHRGRCLHGSKLYDSYDGKMCLYLEFLPNFKIQLRCKRIDIFLNEE